MKKFILLTVLLVGVIVYFSAQSSQDNQPAEKDQPTAAKADIADAKENTELEISAWLPDWSTSSGFESLERLGSKIDTVSPVWFEINADGSLKDKRPRNHQDITKHTSARIIPSIASFDHELMSSILGSETNLERHIEAIVNMVVEGNYEGIDLDYESIKLTDKENYFRLLSSLSEELHNHKKQLTVTVLSKWGDEIAYPSYPETRQVQDWSRIINYASEIRIMTYDYTSAASFYPGPIAPLSWVEDVLAYAVTKVPAKRIKLGIHLYAYQWSVTESKDSGVPVFIPNIDDNPVASTTNATALTYSQVKDILQKNTGRSEEFAGEKIFIYQNGGKQKVLVYQDPQGIKLRMQLASNYDLSGVVFWRLGGEAELLEL